MMNKLVWKLLRRHISTGQLAGFFLANLFGMSIILLSVQGYRDLLPLFSGEDSLLKNDYVVVTKRISSLSSLAGRDNTFSPEEIDELKKQSFSRSVAAFTPSLFNVSAGVGMEQAGISLRTDMFFEAVPDAYVDVSTERWQYTEGSREIPIIIPRNYLNLYNFGFAQSRNLPKLSEGLMGLIQMNITLSGNGHTEQYQGQIVGFSNRLNTILVPQAFMDYANRYFAPGKEAQPSRLIVEVKNTADAKLADYIGRHNYETEGNNLDAGKTTYFLRLVSGIITGVGIIISALSFYILILSIFLLLQKNATKLENLLLLGYSPSQLARPYTTLTVALNLLVWGLSLIVVCGVRSSYIGSLQTLFPLLKAGSLLPAILIGGILTIGVIALNIWIIKRKISKL